MRTSARPSYLLAVPRIAIALSIGIAAFVAAGCSQVSLPPQATLTEIEPSRRPAKGPDCAMPVLRSEPLADFRKVAIVEGLGSRYASEADVMPVVVRKACETGADAILILESRSQTSENMTGYYIDAVAIVYEKRHKVISVAPFGNNH